MLARIVYNGRVRSLKPPTFLVTAINGLSKAYLSSLTDRQNGKYVENFLTSSVRHAQWGTGKVPCACVLNIATEIVSNFAAN